MEYEAVRIYIAQNNIEAEMILAALKECDIPAYKKNLGNSEILNLYGGNSNSGEEIFVADINVEKAMDVLRGMGFVE